MSSAFQTFGELFCIIGGTILAVGIFALAFWLASIVWVAASNNWRQICKAESLIHEYRENREKFLEWLKQEVESDG